MTPLSKLLARQWSALAAKGERPTAEAIAHRVGVDVAVVTRKLAEMRVRGELPDDG